MSSFPLPHQCALIVVLVFSLMSSSNAQSQEIDIAINTSDAVETIALTANEAQIVASSFKAVNIFDFDTQKWILRIPDRRAFVSHNGQLMATINRDLGKIELRDAATGKVLHDFSSKDGLKAQDPVFSGDDTLLLLGWKDSHAELIDVKTGKRLQSFRMDIDAKFDGY